MKRVLGLVLAGLVGAGTLFSGVGIAHAEGEAITENEIISQEISDNVVNESAESGTTDNKTESDDSGQEYSADEQEILDTNQSDETDKETGELNEKNSGENTLNENVRNAEVFGVNALGTNNSANNQVGESENNPAKSIEQDNDNGNMNSESDKGIVDSDEESDFRVLSDVQINGGGGIGEDNEYSNYEYVYFSDMYNGTVYDRTIINELDKKNISDGEKITLGGKRYRKVIDSKGKVLYYNLKPLKWRVIDNDGTNLTLLLDFVYTTMAFYNGKTPTADDIRGGFINWKNSTIRTYLNGAFYNGFTETEKGDILDTTITYSYPVISGEKQVLGTTIETEDNIRTDTCTDKVFILSANDYKNPKFGFESTDGPSSGRIFKNYKGETELVWTRDVGGFGPYSIYVGYADPIVVGKNGALVWGGYHGNTYRDGIQPALRIPVSSKNYYYTLPEDESNYTSTNSPYADNYNLLINGNAINGESFKNLANYIYKDNSAVIPGIEQTNMGDNKTLCKNMVAQGVCVTDKYMLISAYCADRDHNSVIYVLDKSTKEYITTLVLRENFVGSADIVDHMSHVGALEYYDGNVYIADSGIKKEDDKGNVTFEDKDYRIWKLPATDIDAAVNSGADAVITYLKTPIVNNAMSHVPSFIEIHNGYLYVGTFSEKNDNNKLYVYNLNNGNYLKKTLSLNVGKAQGISFFEKDGQTYCIISSSYGRENTSNLYVSKCKTENGMVTEIEKPFKTFKSPNMSEDVDIYEDELFLSFESGANTYALNGGAKLRPLDRVVSLDYKKLVDSNDYPVIVVPGVMGSNLYQNGEKIWSPSLSELLIFLNANRLKISNNLSVKNYDSNGNPVRQNNQGKREYGANDSYKELVDGLCDSTGKPVYFFSYDWRQSNADSAKKLYEFIEKVKTQENVGKVDIVAHSMGGIVTSYYASHKFNDGTKETAGDEQINKVITCSTPYEGSPLLLEKALGTTVLRNVNADYKGYLISSAADAFLYYMEGIKKDVKTKFPSMTQLAPSERLYNQTPWFRQSNVLRNINYAATSENIAKNGTEIMGATLKLTGHQALGSAVENAGSYIYDNINKQYSYSYAKNQLEGYDYNAMTYSEYASLCAEDRHFGSLYGQSRNFLSQIEKDGYNYLRSMDNAYFIVGVNNYTPVSGAFSKDGNNVQKLIYESKGDGTVPYASQTMMKGLEGLVDSAGKKRFYTFTTDHGGTTGHTDISYDKAGAINSLDCVLALLNYGGESTADPVTGKKHVVITIQCPVDAKIEKDGELLNSSDSDFSGTASFGRLDLIGQDGDVKSLCIDDELYNVQLTGTGSGTMDMDLEWYDENDELNVVKQFIDIPLTENTRLHFETNKDGITTLYADIDGDGTDDQKWYADNGEVGYQLTSEISGENQEEQKQEEQKQEESQEKTQPATQSKASASTAQPAQVAKAAPAVTSAATTASKTGDTNLTALWITLSAVSAGILGAIIIAIKKRRAE